MERKGERRERGRERRRERERRRGVPAASERASGLLQCSSARTRLMPNLLLLSSGKLGVCVYQKGDRCVGCHHY